MRCVHVQHDVFTVLFLLLPRTDCIVSCQSLRLNPHIKVVTLIIIKCSNSRYYYIAQRKNKVHTITGSNQTLTADIRNILCVAFQRDILRNN